MTDEPANLPAVQQRSTALRPRNLPEAIDLAERIAQSDMAPPQYKGKPNNVLIAMAMGEEVGLAPLQAVQNIAVIGNRPSIWGDAMLALVMRSPLFEDIEEWFEGEGEGFTAYCGIKRRGVTPALRSYSVSDAKRAGLWGKAGSWKTDPPRMLQRRARARALTDMFSDVLLGLSPADEVADYVDVTPAPSPSTYDSETGEILSQGSIKRPWKTEGEN